MLRSIFPGVIALVVACVLSSGVVVVRARTHAHATADSTARDGIPHSRDSSQVAIGQHAPAAIETLVPPSDTALAPHDSARTVVAKPAAVAPTRGPAPTAPPALVSPVIPKASSVVPNLQPEARLPKLFAAMSARDAAKVLEQMTDTDVISILGGMPDKRAGEILGLLPATRSATIAKQVLGRGKDTP